MKEYYTPTCLKDYFSAARAASYEVQQEGEYAVLRLKDGVRRSYLRPQPVWGEDEEVAFGALAAELADVHPEGDGAVSIRLNDGSVFRVGCMVASVAPERLRPGRCYRWEIYVAAEGLSREQEEYASIRSAGHDADKVELRGRVKQVYRMSAGVCVSLCAEAGGYNRTVHIYLPTWPENIRCGEWVSCVGKSTAWPVQLLQPECDWTMPKVRGNADWAAQENARAFYAAHAPYSVGVAVAGAAFVAAGREVMLRDREELCRGEGTLEMLSVSGVPELLAVRVCLGNVWPEVAEETACRVLLTPRAGEPGTYDVRMALPPQYACVRSVIRTARAPYMDEIVSGGRSGIWCLRAEACTPALRHASSGKAEQSLIAAHLCRALNGGSWVPVARCLCEDVALEDTACGLLITGKSEVLRYLAASAPGGVSYGAVQSGAERRSCVLMAGMGKVVLTEARGNQVSALRLEDSASFTARALPEESVSDERFSTDDEGNTTLMQLCEHEENELKVRAQITAGAPVNAQNCRGITALMQYGCHCSHLMCDYAAALLRAGADPNIVSDTGWTALFSAVKWQDPYTTLLLLRAGADARARLKDGTTLLDMAISRGGNTTILSALLAAGVDPTVPLRSSGLRPLQVIERQWWRERLIREFIAAGAVSSHPNPFIGASLISCINMGDVEGVRRLLSEGANPLTYVRSSSETAAMFAVRRGFDDIARMVLDEVKRRFPAEYHEPDFSSIKQDSVLANKRRADTSRAWRVSRKREAELLYERACQYRDGKGVEKNMDEAIRLFNLAADMGDDYALFLLGKYHADGRYVPKDLEKSYQFYKQSAEQGSLCAQVNLGNAYERGAGTAVDAEKALFWRRKASDDGCPVATNNLACQLLWGEGVRHNRAEGFRLYSHVAADVKNKLCPSDHNYLRVSWYGLGKCYEEGAGVPRDREAALRWYRKSADAGYDDAMCRLGCFYERGIVVEKDETEAAGWYMRAAKRGCTEAHYRIGLCYLRGRGVEKDAALALRHIRRAAADDHKDALYQLGRCYLRGIGVRRNRKRALSYLRRAAEQQSKQALTLLAKLESAENK